MEAHSNPAGTAHAFDAVHRLTKGGPPAEALEARIKELEAAKASYDGYTCLKSSRIVKAIDAEISWRRVQLARQGGQ